jgi:hypothetical protein
MFAIDTYKVKKRKAPATAGAFLFIIDRDSLSGAKGNI